MPDLPQLTGKHYHTRGANGPVLCRITGMKVSCSKLGTPLIDQIQVQRQKTVNGMVTWTTPRWLHYGRHIQQRIKLYEMQKAGGAA
jgi:hypothetical protein